MTPEKRYQLETQSNEQALAEANHVDIKTPVRPNHG